MTKEEKFKLVNSGIIFLRSQWDQKTRTFRIVYLTRSFGWKRLGNSWFFTTLVCEEKISAIIQQAPNKYRREE